MLAETVSLSQNSAVAIGVALGVNAVIMVFREFKELLVKKRGDVLIEKADETKQCAKEILHQQAIDQVRDGQDRETLKDIAATNAKQVEVLTLMRAEINGFLDKKPRLCPYEKPAGQGG